MLVKIALTLALGFELAKAYASEPTAPDTPTPTSRRRTSAAVAADGMFKPLACNSELDAAPCTSWADSGLPLTSDEPVVIPCGRCILLDAATTLRLRGGLRVQGRLHAPARAGATRVLAPHVIVEGVLSAEPPDDVVPSPLHSVSFELDDDAEFYFAPHAENGAACPARGCNVGLKPMVVAGGRLDVRAWPVVEGGCPTWVPLLDVLASPAPGAALPAAPAPPDGCPSALLADGFEADRGGWRATGGVLSRQSAGGAAEGEAYLAVTQRSQAWHGPIVDLPLPCVAPDAPYLLSAHVRIGRSDGAQTECARGAAGGDRCPSLTLRLTATDGSQAWRWLGKAAPAPDGQWSLLTATLSLSPAELASTAAAALYVDGPEPAAFVQLDGVRAQLPGAGAFAAGCGELVANGRLDAHPAHAFPWFATGGQLAVEREGGRSFARARGRSARWMGAAQELPAACLARADAGSSFRLEARVRLPGGEGLPCAAADAAPGCVRAIVRLTAADGSARWLTLGESDGPIRTRAGGWSELRGSLAVDASVAAAAEGGSALLYFESAEPTAVVDVADVSLAFDAGPARALVLPASVARCWRAGAELGVSASTLAGLEDAQSAVVESVLGSGDTATVVLAQPLAHVPSVAADGVPEFAAEVVLLSRNWRVADGGASGAQGRPYPDEGEGAGAGAHVMVLHTPHVAQRLEGVRLHRLGQRGVMGRYPLHLHMCGAVHGTLLSHNAITESHYRCVVVHGSHGARVSANVAWRTSGHCFVLEDGIETENEFVANVGVATHALERAHTLPGESDDEPATFWLANPENSLVANIAAGSAGYGYWYELLQRVRGPSAERAPAGYDPSSAPLGRFEDNVAHSHRLHGLATYPGMGFNPAQTATFERLRAFRNGGAGVFLHNSANLRVRGAQLADNAIGVDFDRAHSCELRDSTVVGLSEPFARLAAARGLRGAEPVRRAHCPAGPLPLVGVQMHQQLLGRAHQLGNRVDNVSFAGLPGQWLGEGDYGAQQGACARSHALGVGEEHLGFFDPRNSVRALGFADGERTARVSLCAHTLGTPAAAAAVSNAAVHDEDGSLAPGGAARGTVVSDSGFMTALGGECAPAPPGSCAALCATPCMRTLSVAVSSRTPAALRLRVTRAHGDTPPADGRPFADVPGFFRDGAFGEDAATKAFKVRRFFVTLPAGGAYSARFVLPEAAAASAGGAAPPQPPAVTASAAPGAQQPPSTWPLFAQLAYEDEPGACGARFSAFELERPTPSAAECAQLVPNGGFEAGSADGWWHAGGGLRLRSPGAPGSRAHALANPMGGGGLLRYLDTRCVHAGARVRLSAAVRLRAPEGSAGACEASGGAHGCARLLLLSQRGTTDPTHVTHDQLPARTAYTGEGGAEGWGTLEADWSFSAAHASAHSVALLLQPPLGGEGADLEIDSVSISVLGGGDGGLPTEPTPPPPPMPRSPPDAPSPSPPPPLAFARVRIETNAAGALGSGQAPTAAAIAAHVVELLSVQPDRVHVDIVPAQS